MSHIYLLSHKFCKIFESGHTINFGGVHFFWNFYEYGKNFTTCIKLLKLQNRTRISTIYNGNTESFWKANFIFWHNVLVSQHHSQRSTLIIHNDTTLEPCAHHIVRAQINLRTGRIFSLPRNCFDASTLFFDFVANSFFGWRRSRLERGTSSPVSTSHTEPRRSSSSSCGATKYVTFNNYSFN